MLEKVREMATIAVVSRIFRTFCDRSFIWTLSDAESWLTLDNNHISSTRPPYKTKSRHV